MVLLESMQGLKPGSQAPAFALRGTDGKIHSSQEFAGHPLLIVFMCNHCPYVLPKIPELKRLQEKYKKQGLIIIGINPNDAVAFPEDDFEHMKCFVSANGMNFLYLHDETQEVAKAYGATCTPDPFLFDASGKLFYHGRIDDAMSPTAKPTTANLDDAIARLLAKKPVQTAFLPSRGCSIKWK